MMLVDTRGPHSLSGEHGDFDVMFLGKDGQAGGYGVNADWGNWQ